MELKQSLQESGLTSAEAKIYETLLKSGPLTSGMLSQKSDVPTSNIYMVLNKLIEKGLVSYSISSSTKQFKVEGVKHLQDYFKTQQEKLKKQEQTILQAIPLLQKTTAMTKSPEITIYKGINGVKSAQETVLNVLKKNETFYVIATSPAANENLMPYFNNFHERRAKKGIRYKVIYSKALTEFAEERKKYHLTEVKVLSESIQTPSVVWIFNGHIVIADFTETPTIVKIKNNAIADTFKTYFDLLWKHSNK